jgi:hypothetical protein
MANFATFNPLHPGTTSQLSEGNTVFKHIDNADGTTGKTNGFCFPSTGKYYIEITQLNAGNSQIYGLMSDVSNLAYYRSPEYSCGNATTGFDFDYRTGNSNMPSVSIGSSAAGDIMQILVDCDNQRFKFGRNDTFEMFGRTPPSDTKYGTDDNLTWFPMDPTGETRGGISLNGKYSLKLDQNLHIGVNDGGSGSLTQCKINFGQFPWRYDPPSGFVALSTENLVEPAISNLAAEKPEDYFNTVLWTGNGTSTAVTNVGFQPDLLWIKERTSTSTSKILDVIRGVNSHIQSSENSGANGNINLLTSFDSDGFTVGTDGGSNESGQDYVAWCWKAGGTAVENTDGSITSQVSANTKSGFSIVSYTGTNAAATVGHGLGVKPQMIFAKNTSDSTNWRVYSEEIGAANRLQLNDTSVSASSSSTWNNTEPTSTVFSVANSTETNGSGDAMIAYCFHSVEGFSKFGSYTGNGSTDGPFIFTGFRPKWVMFKRISGNPESWFMMDTVRTPYNAPSNAWLLADTSAAEPTSNTRAIDFLSNGIKLRQASGYFNDPQTYIYMAFADSPFKYSSAR